MKTTRDLVLERTESVLLAAAPRPGVAVAVIAGEACTELGCDTRRKARMSWLERWFGLGLASGRLYERRGHGT